MNNLAIEYIEDNELPHSVKLNRNGEIIYGHGTTLEGALLRVISLVETEYTNVVRLARELDLEIGDWDNPPKHIWDAHNNLLEALVNLPKHEKEF